MVRPRESLSVRGTVDDDVPKTRDFRPINGHCFRTRDFECRCSKDPLKDGQQHYVLSDPMYRFDLDPCLLVPFGTSWVLTD